MDAAPTFLTTLLTFPAVIPGILLAVLLVYWLFVIIGALDIDFLDFDMDVDGLEGGGFFGLFSAIGMVGVPITISLSLLILSWWIICVPTTWYLMQYLPTGWLQLIAGFVVLVIALIVAMRLTIFLIKPFRKLFITHAHQKVDLYGKLCVITTGRVDENFGQASYDDGGAGLILAVRAETPNNLRKGSNALIIEYNEAQQSYTVIDYNESR
ncbi:Uncharacterised protein [Candidatus Venteria ishoeyi]|uniref:Ubiquinone biosynthesis protein UbiH n=2 Tax=Candidatus Venteria ishoeyi TaxID=1899563 RepID=A0A1H6FHD0_9GAMM|nr:Uncharacterised protein [Candidatus Venteria ishoeyi]